MASAPLMCIVHVQDASSLIKVLCAASQKQYWEVSHVLPSPVALTVQCPVQTSWHLLCLSTIRPSSRKAAPDHCMHGHVTLSGEYTMHYPACASQTCHLSLSKISWTTKPVKLQCIRRGHAVKLCLAIVYIAACHKELGKMAVIRLFRLPWLSSISHVAGQEEVSRHYFVLQSWLLLWGMLISLSTWSACPIFDHLTAWKRDHQKPISTKFGPTSPTERAHYEHPKIVFWLLHICCMHMHMPFFARVTALHSQLSQLSAKVYDHPNPKPWSVQRYNSTSLGTYMLANGLKQLPNALIKRRQYLHLRRCSTPQKEMNEHGRAQKDLSCSCTRTTRKWAMMFSAGS